jgi:hypothetical protein
VIPTVDAAAHLEEIETNIATALVERTQASSGKRSAETMATTEIQD